jgi:zinc protease
VLVGVAYSSHNVIMHHEVTYHDLKGGARLMAVRMPNTITYYWASFFKAGFRFMSTEKYEIPHLAEHMAFAGTKSYPDDLKFKIEIERDGTGYNATTGGDLVSYYFVGSRDQVKRIIPLNMSQIYEPLFEQKKIEQEQQVITREMSQKSEEDNWRLSYTSTNLIFPEANPDITQRIQNIATLSKKDLEEYHRTFYGTANTGFVLAGDYSDKELEEIIALVNGYLDKSRPGTIQQFKSMKLGDFGGKIHVLEPHRPSQAAFTLRFIRPGRDEKNYPALKLISLMLTGSLSSRLQRKAREGGLTYGIGTSAPIDDEATMFSVSSQTGVKEIQDLVTLSAQEIAAIGKGEYSDEELAHAKGFTVGSIRRSYQLPSQFAGWYIEQFVYGLERESPEDWIGKIEAVTRQDIQRAYAAYFRRDQSLLSMVGKDLKDRVGEYDQILDKHFA